MIGLYLAVKVLPDCFGPNDPHLSDDVLIRKWANQELGSKVWCSVYTVEEIGESFQTVGKTVIISGLFQDKVEFDYR